jgi:hypothetical protein
MRRGVIEGTDCGVQTLSVAEEKIPEVVEVQPKRVLLLAKHFQRGALALIVDAVIAGVCAHAGVTIATEPHANALGVFTATDVVEFERNIGIAFTAARTARVFGHTRALVPSPLSS